MKVVKLFEQWLAEEEAIDSPKKEESPKPANSHTINVSGTDAGDFEIIATADSKDTTDSVNTFSAISSTNSSIKSGAAVMVSPKAEKSGDFDIVIINNREKPEESLIYSGQVITTKS
jgi:hypothetical protein